MNCYHVSRHVLQESQSLCSSLGFICKMNSSSQIFQPSVVRCLRWSNDMLVVQTRYHSRYDRIWNWRWDIDFCHDSLLSQQ